MRKIWNLLKKRSFGFGIYFFGSNTNTKVGLWFRFQIPKPGLSCTLIQQIVQIESFSFNFYLKSKINLWSKIPDFRASDQWWSDICSTGNWSIWESVHFINNSFIRTDSERNLDFNDSILININSPNLHVPYIQCSIKPMQCW